MKFLQLLVIAILIILPGISGIWVNTHAQVNQVVACDDNTPVIQNYEFKYLEDGKVAIYFEGCLKLHPDAEKVPEIAGTVFYANDETGNAISFNYKYFIDLTEKGDDGFPKQQPWSDFDLGEAFIDPATGNYYALVIVPDDMTQLNLTAAAGNENAQTVNLTSALADFRETEPPEDPEDPTPDPSTTCSDDKDFEILEIREIEDLEFDFGDGQEFRGRAAAVIGCVQFKKGLEYVVSVPTTKGNAVFVISEDGNIKANAPVGTTFDIFTPKQIEEGSFIFYFYLNDARVDTSQEVETGTRGEEEEEEEEEPNEEAGGRKNIKELCSEDGEEDNADQACVTCYGRGGIWIAVGCVDPTPLGIMTRLIQTAIGVMGGVALFQLIMAGLQYQRGKEEEIEKAKKKVIATLTGLVVLVFSVLILRIIGVNVLDIVPGNFL